MNKQMLSFKNNIDDNKNNFLHVNFNFQLYLNLIRWHIVRHDDSKWKTKHLEWAKKHLISDSQIVRWCAHFIEWNLSLCVCLC